MDIILNNHEFKVIDTKEKITIADSFVVRQNKIGGGNGEAKLYIGQDGQETRNFFGGNGFAITCFLMKQDLQKYLEDKKSIQENLDQYYSQDDEDLDIDLSQPEGCESCDRDKPELDMDVMDPNELERLSRIIEEWGLTEYDLEDSDVIEELADEFLRRNGNGLEEGIALKDKAGNISYVKDDAEANQKMNDARAKGIQLTKQNV